jgi:hypothetical protein
MGLGIRLGCVWDSFWRMGDILKMINNHMMVLGWVWDGFGILWFQNGLG